MDDDAIIQLFFERREDAVEQVRIKYHAACMHLLRNLLQNEHDAEECANDVYLALWNTITFHVSDDDGEWEDIHFHISCDYGTVHCPDVGTMPAIGEPITIPNGTVIYWDYYGRDHVATEEELSNATLDNLYMTDGRIAYVNILIFSADNIVGYAILRMNTTTVEEYAEHTGKTVVHDKSWWDGGCDPDTTVYCPGGDHIDGSRYKVELLESVCFPKVDGVYQKISEQYVSNRIAACKED